MRPASVARMVRVGESARIGGAVLDGFGEAEVEDFDDAFGGDDDVAGFEVAVDDALVVGGFEGFGDLAGYVEGFS